MLVQLWHTSSASTDRSFSNLQMSTPLHFQYFRFATCRRVSGSSSKPRFAPQALPDTQTNMADRADMSRRQSCRMRDLAILQQFVVFTRDCDCRVVAHNFNCIPENYPTPWPCTGRSVLCRKCDSPNNQRSLPDWYWLGYIWKRKKKDNTRIGE